MKRLIAITGMALLMAVLISWVALAGAQPNRGQPTSINDPSAETGAAGAGEESGQAGAIPLQPQRYGQPAARPDDTPKGPTRVPLTPLPQQQPAAGAPREQMPTRPATLPMGDPAASPEGNARPAAAARQPFPGPATGTVLPPLGSDAPADALPAANGEQSTELSMTSSRTNSRQEPAVRMEWIGPAAAKVGQPNNYGLVVRNICNIPVQQVLVRVRIPAGLSCTETAPKAIAESDVLVWELGVLQANEEKVLQMKLLAEEKGEAAPQAWVTFTGSSVLHVKVCEPKLELKVKGPPTVLLGETVAFQLAVSNPGDGSADHVKIHAALSEGLECPRGSQIDFDIGNLAAGETRNVTVMCLSKLGGAQKCEAAAEAEGGLHSQAMAPIRVTMPRLELQLMGPGLRYLGRKALYTLKVSNPGNAPATNVTIRDLVPDGFKVLAASDGGRHDFSAHTVSWFVGEIKPGETREVKLEVQAVNPGESKHKASAVAAHNLCAESELGTRIEGLSALMLEMVDTDDPIEVDSETAYEVRITNTGSKVETDIKLAATIPDKMEFKNATSPVRFHEEGKSIVFEPLEKLAPRADAIFRIHVKAREPGTVRFKIQMTSTNLTEPVIKMEATRIYSDAPETTSSH